MKFFAIAASFVAAVAAQGYDTGASAETCSAVTVTETVTLPYGVHTPSAPATSAGATIPPYPTGEAPYPSVAPSGTGAVSYPAAGGASSTGAASGTAAPVPSASASYSVPAGEFTGAASAKQIGGFVAGVGAFAAFFL